MEEEEHSVEAVAEDVYRMMRENRYGTVIAVWKDGSITVEGFAFRGRRQPDGARIEPIVTYPSKASLTYREVLERLIAGLQRHGLLPIEPPSRQGRAAG
ncbi:MAG: hypothetical protein ACM3S1_07795 [Hyphomicrobiales bacterium]